MGTLYKTSNRAAGPGRVRRARRDRHDRDDDRVRRRPSVRRRAVPDRCAARRRSPRARSPGSTRSSGATPISSPRTSRRSMASACARSSSSSSTATLDPATLTSGTAGLVDRPTATAIAMDWHYDADRHVLAGSPPSGQRAARRHAYAAYVDDGGHRHGGRRSALRARAIVRSPARAGGRPPMRSRALQRDDVVGARGVHHAARDRTARRRARRDGSAARPTLAFADPAIIFRRRRARFAARPRDARHRRSARRPRALGQRQPDRHGARSRRRRRHRHDDRRAVSSRRHRHRRPRGQDVRARRRGRPVAHRHIPITFILPAAPPPADRLSGRDLRPRPRREPRSAARRSPSRSRRRASRSSASTWSATARATTRPTTSTTSANQLPQFSGDAAMRDGFGDTTGLATSSTSSRASSSVVGRARHDPPVGARSRRASSQLVHARRIWICPRSVRTRSSTRRTSRTWANRSAPSSAPCSRRSSPTSICSCSTSRAAASSITCSPNSAEIGSLALPLIESIYGPQLPLDRWNPQIGLMQAVIDGADPLTYAPHVLARSLRERRPAQRRVPRGRRRSGAVEHRHRRARARARPRRADARPRATDRARGARVAGGRQSRRPRPRSSSSTRPRRTARTGAASTAR